MDDFARKIADLFGWDLSQPLLSSAAIACSDWLAFYLSGAIWGALFTAMLGAVLFLPKMRR